MIKVVSIIYNLLTFIHPCHLYTSWMFARVAKSWDLELGTPGAKSHSSVFGCITLNMSLTESQFIFSKMVDTAVTQEVCWCRQVSDCCVVQHLNLGGIQEALRRDMDELLITVVYWSVLVEKQN